MLRIARTLCLLITLSCVVHAQEFAFGPYVGGVTDTSARIMVRATSPMPLQIEWSADPAFRVFEHTTGEAPLIANDLFAVRTINPLRPSTTYFVRARTASAVSPVHQFTTFPPARSDAPFRFTFGSCMYGAPFRGEIFPRMAQDTFLFFMQDGDWRYPDEQIGTNFQSNDSLLDRAYRAKFDTAYPLERILSTHAFDYVWDDHDCGKNNTDGTAPGSAKNRAAYDARLPHYPLANDSAGIWHSFLCGNVEFIVCDLRSQRSPNAEAFDPSGAFNPRPGHSILAGFPVVGEDQRTWLLRTLRTSTARWRVIVSSVPFVPQWKDAIMLALLAHQTQGAHELADKWAGFPADIDSVERTVTENHIKNTVLISGDVHNSAMDNGTHSFFPEVVAANLDITNSGLYLAQKSVGFDLFSQGGQTDTLNTYGRITVVTAPRHQLRLEIIDQSGALVASYVMEDSSSTAGITQYAALTDDQLDLYPSPCAAGDRVTVRGAARLSPVVVHDILGRTVQIITVDNDRGIVEIDTRRYAPGPYVVSSSAKTHASGLLIVAH